MFLFIRDGLSQQVVRFPDINLLDLRITCHLHTIHRDAISKMRICKDLLAVRYCQRRSPAPACGGVEGLEGRDR